MAATVLLVMTGCSPPNATQTVAAMKSKLTAAIPVGTSVSVAKSRLKARGFAITPENNAAWGDRKRANYIYGSMYVGGVVRRRWQVAVFYHNGLVTDIDVKTGLVGP